MTAVDDAIELLRSPNVEEVESAALRLGLAVERKRFERRGEGELGSVESLLGDLKGVALSEAEYTAVVNSLVAHVDERGIDASPTVVWALGKAHDRQLLSQIAALADRIMTDPSRSELLYQSISVIALVSPGDHEVVLLRAAREADGEARDLAQHWIDTFG